jgi:hypothetical protein
MKRRLRAVEGLLQPLQAAAEAAAEAAAFEARATAIFESMSEDDVRSFLRAADAVDNPPEGCSRSTLNGLPCEFSTLDDAGNVLAPGNPKPIMIEAGDWATYRETMKALDPGFAERLRLYEEESDWIRAGFPPPDWLT